MSLSCQAKTSSKIEKFKNAIEKRGRERERERDGGRRRERDYEMS